MVVPASSSRTPLRAASKQGFDGRPASPPPLGGGGSNTRAVLLSNFGRRSCSSYTPTASTAATEASAVAQRRPRPTQDRSPSVTSLCSPRAGCSDSWLFGGAAPPLRSPPPYSALQPALPGPKDLCQNNRFRDRYAKCEVFSDRGRRHFSPTGRTDPLSQATPLDRNAALRKLAVSSSVLPAPSQASGSVSMPPGDLAAGTPCSTVNSPRGSMISWPWRNGGGENGTHAGVDSLFSGFPGAWTSPRRRRSNSPPVSVCGDLEPAREAERWAGCPSRPRQPSMAEFLKGEADVDEHAHGVSGLIGLSARRPDKARNSSEQLSALLHSVDAKPLRAPDPSSSTAAERSRCVHSGGSLETGFRDSFTAGTIEEEFGTKKRGRIPSTEAIPLSLPWATHDADGSLASTPGGVTEQTRVAQLARLAQLARNCLQSPELGLEAQLEAETQAAVQPQVITGKRCKSPSGMLLSSTAGLLPQHRDSNGTAAHDGAGGSLAVSMPAGAGGSSRHAVAAPTPRQNGPKATPRGSMLGVKGQRSSASPGVTPLRTHPARPARSEHPAMGYMQVPLVRPPAIAWPPPALGGMSLDASTEPSHKRGTEEMVAAVSAAVSAVASIAATMPALPPASGGACVESSTPRGAPWVEVDNKIT